MHSLSIWPPLWPELTHTVYPLTTATQNTDVVYSGDELSLMTFPPCSSGICKTHSPATGSHTNRGQRRPSDPEEWAVDQIPHTKRREQILKGSGAPGIQINSACKSSSKYALVKGNSTHRQGSLFCTLVNNVPRSAAWRKGMVRVFGSTSPRFETSI